MSVSVLDEPLLRSNVATAGGAERGSDLSDIFDQYVADDSLPPPQWLTHLKLDRPRRNTRCLGEATRLAKRLTDILVASTMLLLLWPLMLAVALAVRVTSPGPIIFRQTRVGLNARRKRRDRRGAVAATGFEGEDRRQQSDRRNDPGFGKPFTLYKFRTMRVDAESSGAQFAVKGDRRVTPIGAFLRRTRLDELPQLWNVVRGEMSLVGPRPERPEFIEGLTEQIPNYINRLRLKPGLTGLAQVINGYDNDIEGFRRKVNLDLLYLQNCCLWNDIKILFRTVHVVITGKGAI